MKNLNEIVEECRLSFDDIQNHYQRIFNDVFDKQVDWLKNVDEKLSFLKPSIRLEIESVIQKLINPKYLFDKSDTQILSTFTAYINNIILIANRINNFKEGVKLDNGLTLSLYDLFNSIKNTERTSDFNFPLNQNLNNFKSHLFSVVKHCQNPSYYPIYYKYWKNIFTNVLKNNGDYDSLCDFYRKFPITDRHLSFGAYFGAIGVILAGKISENKIIKENGDANFRLIKEDYLNLDEYFNLIVGYKGRNANYRKQFENWLRKSTNANSNMRSSYIRAIEILSIILKDDLFQVESLKDLEILYDDLLLKQKKDNGKYYFENAKSYGQKGFYSASIASYIDFIKSLSMEYKNVERETISHVKNIFSQAVCVIGASGVGKTYRVNKTLEYVGHKTLSVIVDNMWQHILVDYSPDERRYRLTKVGEFIKQASNNPTNHYTIVIDECHKNLDIINDVLLQAISTRRNDGIRFLSLNSLVDNEFSFLNEKYGNRILPDNLGFILISSKSEIIEGNDDLKNRIDIVELEEADQLHEDFTIDYLLNKKRVEVKNEYSY